MTNLFAFFTKPGARIHFSGAPFLLGSILLMTSALVAFSILKSEKSHTTEEVPQFNFEETQV
jgi:DHA1 family tetracycline resistance protein-like MFS transporter